MFAFRHYDERAATIAELLAGGVRRFGGAVISFAPGEEVVGEGDPTENFFLVMGGLFRAVKFSPDGRRQVFAFYMAGDLCGLEPDGTHKLTIEAVDNAAMAILPRRSCRLRMIDHPEVISALFDGATRALGQAERAASMVRNQASRSSAELRPIIIM